MHHFNSNRPDWCLLVPRCGIQGRRAPGVEPEQGNLLKGTRRDHRPDDYMCTLCAITGGEAYPNDSTQTAVLAVAKRAGANSGAEWATICKRCNAGGAGRRRFRTAHVVSELSGADRQAFARWTAMGRREVSAAERAWSMCLPLPDEERQRFSQISA